MQIIPSEARGATRTKERFVEDVILDKTCQALSTLAGMPVRHYQLFKFSIASEAVLPDNRIVLAPLTFASCVLERVMGTVFARRALPASVDRALEKQSGETRNH